MSSKRTNRILSRLEYEFACHFSGYCPTSKEIQNSEIKEIATRLKANSNKETLTNVLGWQGGRISYWYERWVLSPPFWILIALAYFFLLFSLFFNIQICREISAILASCAVTVLLIIVALIRNRKIPTWSGMTNSFASSISMEFLLKYKLAICRDYAKLTACLLSNIYPDAEIYFASAFQHVATGIMIEDRLYVLDKWLPVVTIDKWHERWKSEKPLKRIKGNCLESVNMNSFLSKIKFTKPNTEKLAIEMAKLLNVKEQTSNANWSSLEILRWKKGGMLYEDNEIVNYSLSQLIKNEILGERLELSQITKLEVIQDKNDLIFRVRFKLDK
jgi:predicted transglutaminase-like protease